MSLIEQKKNLKRSRLLKSAYELFKEKGIANTSIAEISKRSHVAKGTFYLYFKDKEEITNELYTKLSRELLQNGFRYALANDTGNITNNFIIMIDNMMDELKENKALLSFLQRDFIFHVSKEQLIHSMDPLFLEITETLKEYASEKELSAAYVSLKFYALLSMCASVCYSTIMDNFPCSIDELKPILHDIIRSSLNFDELDEKDVTTA